MMRPVRRPILQTQPQEIDPRTGAILTDPTQAQTNTGALAQPMNQPQTGNARQSNRVPRNLIDMRSEGLIRIGGKMAGAAENGVLDAMAAGSSEYADIEDYNRRVEDDAFILEEARRQAIQDRIDRQTKIDTKNKPSVEDQAAAQAKLQIALEVLKGFDERDGVVGFGSLLTQTYDRLTDDKRENIRLKLKTLQVDRILSNVARTKGAISEKEMEIFASDQPAWWAGEDIWRKWVEDYAEALRVMNTNLQGGSTTGSYNDGSTSSDFNGSGSSSASADDGFSFVDPE